MKYKKFNFISSCFNLYKTRTMRRLIFFFVLVQICFISYGQIIADHTIVDKYNQIPQQYIDKVKKMLVDMAGESHSSTYIIGANLLEVLDPKFQSFGYGFQNIVPDYTDQYLRIGKQYTTGEEQYFTSQAAIDAYKSAITTQNSTGNPFTVMGFAWCWDMTYPNAPGGTVDPVYNVRWAGASAGGPQGEKRWGLDSGDEVLTGNSVCMDTYLAAVEQYIKYCSDNSYSTKIIFTTGPVDDSPVTTNGTESGFQREIKHDYIRSYVSANNSRILFDYADIICWNNGGVENIVTWNDGGNLRNHAQIHPDNMMDYDASWNLIAYTEDGDHIGEVGALRIAKAMWWMLARIAGWDGGITTGISRMDRNTSSQLFIEQSPYEIRIKLENSSINATVSLYNLSGNMISSKRTDSNPCVIDISYLTSGTYIVVLSETKTLKTQKIIIP
jgi:hypothetical protein